MVRGTFGGTLTQGVNETRYIPQDKIGTVEKFWSTRPGALLLELRHSGHPCLALTCGSCLPSTRGQQGAKLHPAGHHTACPARQSPAATKPKKMSTEPKFDIVPVARKTQQIASALWQQRPRSLSNHPRTGYRAGGRSTGTFANQTNQYGAALLA